MAPTARRGIFVAPFDELADPRRLAGLTARAEDLGWDGFFLWDHIVYSAPTSAVLDPWVVLGAMAQVTERIELGPMVTPLSRRRIHKLARETATLDVLSGGRLILGVGLGSDRHGELAPFGEVHDPREQARLLDDGLDALVRYWDGEFDPRPVRRPPVWCAATWPNRRPLARAARWDGLFPVGVPEPDALAELVADVSAQRAAAGRDPQRFDVAITVPPGQDPAPWVAAGATWTLTEFDGRPRLAAVEAALEAGPRG
ncbi:LLM class flavin-dependent oxidoreductase [Baekduia soli]|uniref:LLM class flavin-dependent oxidoreductase n=1 Tax=Baekduia soli TaxID=496014 RepID=A0A5B8U4Z1_9ACTN|nr:LLM class flavin-dependent oxidoreductase [Baekduia soli]QEC48143.1 LLM class flavin-dependent oxidoreductase [Baekduia soli]